MAPRFILGSGRKDNSLGGFIDVESTPGSGSVFMVTLPLKQAAEIS
jgi:signal transduction histidine kinase